MNFFQINGYNKLQLIATNDSFVQIAIYCTVQYYHK